MNDFVSKINKTGNMNKFRTLFGNTKCVIMAMVHVSALPGTPKYEGSIAKIIDKACAEAEIYASCNVDSIIIENMHDVPYVQAKDFGPEIVSFMTKVCTEVKRIAPLKMPCGVQILSGGNKEALAVAKICGFQFARIESYVFSHIGDEGFMDAQAGILLRFRKKIEADDILVFTDIKKKHSSHAITNDLKIEEVARAAEFFLSDGLILTGSCTGDPVDTRDFINVRGSTSLPILLGSGVTVDNVQNYIKADALIVGSHFKQNGRWEEDLCKSRICKFMDRIFELRTK